PAARTGVTPEAIPAQRLRGVGSRRAISASSTTEAPEVSPTSVPPYQGIDWKMLPSANPAPAPSTSAAMVFTVAWLLTMDATAATARVAAPRITSSSAPMVRLDTTHAAPEAATTPPDAVE